MAKLTDTVVEGYLLVGGDASSQNINTNTHNTDTSNINTLNANKVNTTDLAVTNNIKAQMITLVPLNGSSPIVISSDTMVPNLNAEFLHNRPLGGSQGIAYLDIDGYIADALLPMATTDKKGAVKISTSDEIRNGGDNVITATQLKTAISGGTTVPFSSETIKGIARFATINEIDTNYSNELVAVSTKNLKKGLAGGVASLDINNKLLVSNLPDASYTTKGATQYATNDTAYTGTSIDTSVTPASLAYTIKEKIYAKSIRYILDVNNWGDTGIYTIYDVNITENSIIEISPDLLTITDIQLKAFRNANLSDYSTQSNGYCKIVVRDTIPTVSIPIRVIITGEIYS